VSDWNTPRLHQDPHIAAELGWIKGTVRDYVALAAEEFRECLRRYGVDDVRSEQALTSGYSLRHNIRRPGAAAPTTCVWDTLYGDKELSALFEVEDFVEYLMASPGERKRLREARRRVKHGHEHVVRSLAELRAMLKAPPHSEFVAEGAMCFRGQPREHYLTRPVPNPVLADEDGRERQILPAAWREYREDLLARPNHPDRQLLRTIAVDHLVYYGIRPGKLWRRDFDDPTPAERRKFERRHRRHKARLSTDDDMAAVEQHYGVKTRWLDVTFDARVAAFFATHTFQRGSAGTWHCSPLAPGHRESVIYAFVFYSPTLTQTTDIIRELGIFGHCRPLRPRAQKCALRYYGPFAINEAAADLHATFKLAPDFSPKGLPTFPELFPEPERDPFYRAVLDIKAVLPDVWPYSEFAEYDDSRKATR
jgi:hypothetical protein